MVFIFRLFLAVCFCTPLFAEPGDVELEPTSLSRWIHDQLASVPDETEILEKLQNSVAVYSSHQTERYIGSLKEGYIQVVSRFYSRSFPRETPGLVPNDKYIEGFRQIFRRIQEKEHRFVRGDSVAVHRIGLKLAFIEAFGQSAWEDFIGNFYADLSEGLKPSGGFTGKQIPEELSAQRETYFYQLLEVDLRRLSLSESQVTRFLNRVKKFGNFLVSHDPKEPPFFLALKIHHVLQYSPWSQQKENDFDVLETETWNAFARSVNKEFSGQADAITKKFLQDATEGRLRELTGKNIGIRFEVVRSNEKRYLITVVEPENAKEKIVVINPPNTLANGGLDVNDKELTRFLYRLRSNAVIVDYRGGDFQVTRIVKRDAAWHPRTIGQNLWAAYAPWSSGSVAAGIASIIINGGTRYYTLMTAVSLHPDKYQMSYLAMGMYLSYMFGTAALGRAYDNLFKGLSAGSELFFKVLLAMPFTTLGFMLLTDKHPDFKTFLIGIPLAFIDKIGGTLNRRLIRFLEKEGIVKGDIVIRTGHLNLDILKALITKLREENPPGREVVRYERGLFLREIEGYIRNFLVSRGTSLSPAGSVIGQIMLGEVCNTVAWMIARKRIARYRAEGNQAMVTYYHQELRKLSYDFLLIPEDFYKAAKKGIQWCVRTLRDVALSETR